MRRPDSATTTWQRSYWDAVILPSRTSSSPIRSPGSFDDANTGRP